MEKKMKVKRGTARANRRKNIDGFRKYQKAMRIATMPKVWIHVRFCNGKVIDL